MPESCWSHYSNTAGFSSLPQDIHRAKETALQPAWYMIATDLSIELWTLAAASAIAIVQHPSNRVFISSSYSYNEIEGQRVDVQYSLLAACTNETFLLSWSSDQCHNLITKRSNHFQGDSWLSILANPTKCRPEGGRGLTVQPPNHKRGFSKLGDTLHAIAIGCDFTNACNVLTSQQLTDEEDENTSGSFQITRQLYDKR